MKVHTFDSPISDLVWNEKYRHPADKTKADSFQRVAKAVYKADGHPDAANFAAQAYQAMLRGDWVPAGRIHAGAGTGRRVTLINCFVSPTIEDSMTSEKGVGIMDALSIAAYSQQMGGGIGMDFSTLRPLGAVVQRTGSVSDGPLKFMDMWNSMCSTIMSSGSRRGAMMGTLADDHPDLFSFIDAKRQKGRLTNFNISVLVSDALMKAVRDDVQWDLGFRKPRADGKHVVITVRNDEPWYVYQRLRAREVWDRITRSTYVHAEPGVIFIDRVNQRNPLAYCEEIRCSNPCGEQMLPPSGSCDLGAVNLATMVNDPFGLEPSIDYDRIAATAAIGTRFLDNVLDVTEFPVDEQGLEAARKRRIGLGITGLGNMLQQLKIRYGSERAIQTTRRVMETLRNSVYRTSIELAKERGPFPAFRRDEHLEGAFVKTLPQELQDGIAEHGLRNGVCLTVAPTGTTSIYYGNVSSGCEPTYAWEFFRKVLKADNSFEELAVEDYGYRLYRSMHPAPKDGRPESLPDYMVTATELTVREHIVMQAACQEYVDSSISKTINCPEAMTFEQFQDVYTMAYDCGLKGCTTYRPDPESERGAVLSTERQSGRPKLAPRPPELPAKVYKMKPAGMEHAMYMTVSDMIVNGKRRPYEMFINSKAAADRPWTDALTRTISSTMRLTDGDVGFLAEELQQVHSAAGGFWIGKKYVPSVPALIGRQLQHHLVDCGLMEADPMEALKADLLNGASKVALVGARECPKCAARAYVFSEGCWRCTSCSHSNCG